MNVVNSTPHRTILYALGSNGNYQLGIGHDEDVSRPTRCWFLNDQNNACDHVPLEHDEKIVKTASGGNHTLLLTTLGKVWVAGSNEDGQLGIGGLPTNASGHEGNKIAADGESSLTSDMATSWVWRYLTWTGRATDVLRPRLNITDIAASWSASFFVVDHHEIWSCGAGDKGELGQGNEIQNSVLISKMFDLADHYEEETGAQLVRISACLNHVVVQTSTGQLYGWGACRKGQLGIEVARTFGKSVWKPQHLGIEQALGLVVTNFVTARDFTFVIGKEPGQFALLGDRTKLKLGESQPESIFHHDLKPQDCFDPIEIDAGWTHVIARTSQGKLHGFGPNNRGQLFQASLDASIHILAVGSEHSVALLEDGTVAAWGWGEHGNCGAEVDTKGNVRDRYNKLELSLPSSKVIMLGAGCATTFVATLEPFPASQSA